MPNLFGRFLRHPVVHNVLALYGVNISNYFIPLITVPYLARVLGPKEWGMVAFAQAFGQYIILVVEYGFDLSATRETARIRNSPERCAELIAGVLGAKMVLALGMLVVVLIIYRWVPPFQEHPRVLWAGVFWALAMAFTLRWYFQGMERMRLVAMLEVGSKVLALFGILLLIRSPEDGWKVLGVQGVASMGSTLMTFILAYREIPLRLPSLSKITSVLRLGWTMFLFRASASLYTVGNSFVLGLFSAPQVVAYYAGAEKISKAFLGLLGPISQALYPRLSYLAESSRHEAAKLARVGLVVMAFGGGFMGLIIFVLAPLLVRILLGDGYDSAIPVLRLLALLPPLIALSNVFGIQWMLPLGCDRPFNVIILVAGVLNLCLAIIFAPGLGALGMGWAVVASEGFVTITMYLVLRRRHLDPITYTRKARGEIR